MNLGFDLSDWKFQLIGALVIIVFLARFYLFFTRKQRPDDSPFRKARNLDDVVTGAIYSLGDKPEETPYLSETTLRSTMGVRLGTAAIIVLMLVFVFGPPLGSKFEPYQGADKPLNWVILVLSFYQVLWIARFYVKYDAMTLETITWLHQKRVFEQRNLVAVIPNHNSQLYKLHYTKGHANVLMYIQNRKKFLEDMYAKIAENDLGGL